MSWVLEKESLPLDGDIIEKVEISLSEYRMTFKSGKRIFIPCNHLYSPDNWIEVLKDKGLYPPDGGFYLSLSWDEYLQICEEAKLRDDYVGTQKEIDDKELVEWKKQHTEINKSNNDNDAVETIYDNDEEGEDEDINYDYRTKVVRYSNEDFNRYIPERSMKPDKNTNGTFWTPIGFDIWYKTKKEAESAIEENIVEEKTKTKCHTVEIINYSSHE
jgi:hypothetical protein